MTAALCALPALAAAQSRQARASFEIRVTVALPCTVGLEGHATPGCESQVRESLRRRDELTAAARSEVRTAPATVTESDPQPTPTATAPMLVRVRTVEF